MTPQEPIVIDPALIRKPKLTLPPKPKWYELDWLLPAKDLLLVAGGLLVVFGVYQLWPPHSHAMSWMVAGAGLMRLAWLMGKK